MRRLRSIVILVAVLLAVLAVVDRISVRLAQDQLQQRLVGVAGLTGGSVDVTIHGFPFLTQVARGRYADIEVQARGVALEDLRNVDISAQLRGVELSVADLRSGNRPDVPVASAEGYLVLPYSELARRAVEAGADEGLAALSLRQSGDQVAVTARVTVLGVEVQGSGKAQVSFDGRVPQLVVGEVAIDGFGVPQVAVDAVVAALNTVLARALDLPALPYGLELTSAVATSSGIRINAAAVDVVL